MTTRWDIKLRHSGSARFVHVNLGMAMLLFVNLLTRPGTGACALLPALALVLVCGGCADRKSEAPGGASAQIQALSSEHLGGVADAVWRHYSDPEVAKSSYASPALFVPGGGQVRCSAAMIGPNILLSAAHCGLGPWTASFLQYPHQDNADKNFEDFSCAHLVNTWHSSDLALYFCEPNPQNVNPGDKYGYFDLETSPPQVGQPVYSIWANPLDNPAPPQYDVRFYSSGTVTATNAFGTFTTDPALVQIGANGLPDYLTSHERPIAITTNLWCNGGASGSAQISSLTHRYVAGPLSTGIPEGAGRSSLSVMQYLADGTVDPRDPADIDGVQVSRFGLIPSNYGGLLDKNRDGLFDLQHDIEQARGEGPRDWYSFDFGSLRQDALWTPGAWSAVSWDAGGPAREVRLSHGPMGRTDDALFHSHLNLTPGVYRMSWQVVTTSATASSGASIYSENLWVGLTWAQGEAGGYFSTNPTAGNQTMTETVTVPPGASGIELHIRLRDAVDLRISGLTLARQESVMNFDSHDKRLGWRNGISGARGLVVPFVPVGAPPVGSSPGVVNWVGRVNRDASAPYGYSLVNRQLALDAGHYYQLCFSHVTPPDSDSAAPVGNMRVSTSGSTSTGVTFTSSASTWRTVCAPTFAPATDDSTVEFGLSSAGSYMIDDLTITEVPPPQPPPPPEPLSCDSCACGCGIDGACAPPVRCSPKACALAGGVCDPCFGCQ